jgi:hypothetical protein
VVRASASVAPNVIVVLDVPVRNLRQRNKRRLHVVIRENVNVAQDVRVDQAVNASLSQNHPRNASKYSVYDYISCILFQPKPLINGPSFTRVCFKKAAMCMFYVQSKYQQSTT